MNVFFDFGMLEKKILTIAQFSLKVTPTIYRLKIKHFCCINLFGELANHSPTSKSPTYSMYLEIATFLKT